MENGTIENLFTVEERGQAASELLDHGTRHKPNRSTKGTSKEKFLNAINNYEMTLEMVKYANSLAKLESLGDDYFHDDKKINSDNYLKFIVEEVKPFIDKNYSVYTDANHTAVMGSSMGGLISMYAICEYPNVFGKAACLSTHWVGFRDFENNPIPESFFAYMMENLPNAATHKIYFDYGTETLDASYLKYEYRVDEVLQSKGFNQNNYKMNFKIHFLGSGKAGF